MAQKQYFPDLNQPADHRRRFRKVLRSAQGVQKSLLGASLTGMIDVVFNLLIFFVVITTVSQREGFLPGDLPSDPKDQASINVPALPIWISIYAGESFSDCQVEVTGLKQSPKTFGQLYETLAGMHIGKAGLYEADNPVVLRLGAGVSVDQMVKTYNAVVLAGFNNIQFVRSR